MKVKEAKPHQPKSRLVKGAQVKTWNTQTLGFLEVVFVSSLCTNQSNFYNPRFQSFFFVFLNAAILEHIPFQIVLSRWKIIIIIMYVIWLILNEQEYVTSINNKK